MSALTVSVIRRPAPRARPGTREVQRCVLVEDAGATLSGMAMSSFPRARRRVEQAFDMGQAAGAEQRRLGGIGATQTGFRPVHPNVTKAPSDRSRAPPPLPKRPGRAWPRASRAPACG
jgi:hypothetical protein